MRFWWTHLSYLGDLAVLLPCMIVITGWIALCARPVLGRWLLSLFAVGAIVTWTKLLYMAWGWSIPALSFIGVSGHSAFSALVWPVLFSLLVVGCSRSWRFFAALAGYFLALTIGRSRIELQVHSLTEVVAGLGLGLCASFIFLRRATSVSMGSLRRAALLLLVAVAMLPGYGMRFPSEYLLRLIAQRISLNGEVHTRQLLERPR
jgi:membrane-associated phospholipid phosphatase